MKPLVSILLSYYKGEQYLEKYLQNVFIQSFIAKLELIFVGCLLSEQEKKIIEKFENKINIKKIFLNELKTQSECWNIGILNSSTDYCCIWNVDDLRGIYSIENQYNALKNSDANCVHGMFIISNQFGNNFGKLIDHSNYEHSEYKESFLLGPFFMFKKSFCSKNNIYFDEQLKVCSDFSFALHLANKGKIINIQSIDGYFLDIQKGLSTNGDLKQPIERTFLEVKWDLKHKIDLRFVQYIKNFNLNYEKYFGEWNNFIK